MCAQTIAIKASNLSKRFGDLLAVKNVSFIIPKGEILGILGPNGAGKTTIIRLLTGLFKLENRGKIEVFNKNILNNPKEYKLNYGIVPEVSNAFSDFTVLQNLKFSAGIYGIKSKKDIEKRSEKLLRQFDLLDKMHSKTKSLSKGLKQRLNFCLALIHEPPILILDEPTSGLDPMSTILVRKIILQLKNEGKTILITTHDMHEAQNFCDRVLILNKGEIIADESPDKLREQYKTPSTIFFKFESRSIGDDDKNEFKDLSGIQQTSFKDRFNAKKKNEYYTISSNNAIKDISELYSFCSKNKLKISNLKITETSLEEVFLNLVKNSDLANGGKQ